MPNDYENNQNKKHKILNTVFGIAIGLLFASTTIVSLVSYVNSELNKIDMEELKSDYEKLKSDNTALQQSYTQSSASFETEKTTLEAATAEAENKLTQCQNEKAQLEIEKTNLQTQKIAAETAKTNAETARAAAEASLATYTAEKTITINKENVSVSGTAPTKMSIANPQEIIFTADSNYHLPETVTVTGCNYAYDKATGSLKLYNPSGDVTVGINGVKNNTYKMDFSKKCIEYSGENHSFTEMIPAIANLVVGKTSNYISEVSGFTKVNLGKTEDDAVYGYYKLDTDGLFVEKFYILADEEIVIDETDRNFGTVMMSPIDTPVKVNTYADFANYDFSKCASGTTYFEIKNDETNGNVLDYYSYSSSDTTTAFVGYPDAPFFGIYYANKVILQNIDTTGVSNFAYYFGYLMCAEYIDISGVDFDNATNMEGLFYCDSQLCYADISLIKTDNVVNMSQMFSSCENMSIINTSNFDTSNVTNMCGMFTNTSNVSRLDLSNFDTSKVTDMSYMFYASECSDIDISSFDFSKVTTTKSMFGGCVELTNIDLPTTMDTSKVTTMEEMFWGTSKLESFPLEKLDTSACESMESMFKECGMTTIDCSTFNTSKVKTMKQMFDHAKATTINVSNFDTSKVTNFYHTFAYTNVTVLDIESFDTTSCTYAYGMFRFCPNLTTIYVSDAFCNMELVGSNGLDMFQGSTKLVGACGTTFNSYYVDSSYAQIDLGVDGRRGYLSSKQRLTTYCTDSSLLFEDVDDERVCRGYVEVNGVQYPFINSSPYPIDCTASFKKGDVIKIHTFIDYTYIKIYEYGNQTSISDIFALTPVYSSDDPMVGDKDLEFTLPNNANYLISIEFRWN